MTAAKLPFGIGERVTIHALYCDVVHGKFCEEVRLRGTVAGDRRTIYLGPTAEAVTALHAGGAVASLDVPTLPPNAPGVEITLAARDLVLERQPVPGTRRSRLLVTTNGATAAAVAATPANGATASPVAPASESPDAKHATITTSFRAALDAARAELLPAFAAAHVPVDADVMYKLAFSLWQRWHDAGVA